MPTSLGSFLKQQGRAGKQAFNEWALCKLEPRDLAYPSGTIFDKLPLPKIFVLGMDPKQEGAIHKSEFCVLVPPFHKLDDRLKPPAGYDNWEVAPIRLGKGIVSIRQPKLSRNTAERRTRERLFLDSDK
jgi:hypothetical protein